MLVLKMLPDAIRDGNMIRAVIRATGTNQDGATPGITQPSQSAQEELIRKVYKNSALTFDSTRYVEAHGTDLVTDVIRDIIQHGLIIHRYRYSNR